jgi:hypothetical protein
LVGHVGKLCVVATSAQEQTRLKSALCRHWLWNAGATDAARGAADIVLTEPGLSTIVSAIIGARKIFQRMTTYAKYTVAMTFRIAFTFGLLTTIYNWVFALHILHCLRKLPGLSQIPNVVDPQVLLKLYVAFLFLISSRALGLHARLIVLDIVRALYLCLPASSRSTIIRQTETPAFL